MKYKYNGEWVDVNIKALDSMPVGSELGFYGSRTKLPTGWLLCEGQAISRTEYSDLFELIGTTYGAGDGSTTFNIPNKKGRVGVGVDQSQTEFDTLGETGGSKELQKHNHLVGNSAGAGSTSAWGIPSEYNSNMGELYTNEAGAGTSGNLQPYIVEYYIIKAKNTTPTMASIVDTYSTSTQDGYSCDYVNNMIVSNWDANNTRGYIKYPDGTAICYGLYNPDGGISIGATSGKSVEISLPITLSNALYSVNLTKFAGGNGFSFVEESANSPAVDKFYIGLWNNSSSGTCYVMGYYWQVVGRWK